MTHIALSFENNINIKQPYAPRVSDGYGHCFDIDESYCEDLGIDVPTWDDEEPTEVEIDIHISKHEE